MKVVTAIYLSRLMFCCVHLQNLRQNVGFFIDGCLSLLYLHHNKGGVKFDCHVFRRQRWIPTGLVIRKNQWGSTAG